jgi:DnaJ-domain-containing protein 1
MSKYHPDKVAGLGKELQDLAHLKAQAINRAYSALSGN